MYPPTGRFIDVAIHIDDKILFQVTDRESVNFVRPVYETTLPRRIMLGSILTSEYGYLPASQDKQGIYIPKGKCPKPSASPKREGDNVYCMFSNPEGTLPKYVECSGFGGFSDGMTICRFAQKLRAKKEEAAAKQREILFGPDNLD